MLAMSLLISPYSSNLFKLVISLLLDVGFLFFASVEMMALVVASSLSSLSV